MAEHNDGRGARPCPVLRLQVRSLVVMCVYVCARACLFLSQYCVCTVSVHVSTLCLLSVFTVCVVCMCARACVCVGRCMCIVRHGECLCANVCVFVHVVLNTFLCMSIHVCICDVHGVSVCSMALHFLDPGRDHGKQRWPARTVEVAATVLTVRSVGQWLSPR